MASAGTRAGRDGSVTEEERRKEITTTCDFFEATPALRPPAHLAARIFSQLDCVDLLNCSLVCKQWYIDTRDLREGWENEYLETFNVYPFLLKR
ncbi:hypothetical protein IEQ34_011306 [Dendrobium chrysotoxum]|uniref:F-box domain-containing protein n=1 Tax=Dendrobium chrysotoxum TaxID=161865 RepID=A0AAV7GYM6_DENCH|nr:hypothetical protein IEQ34_011306 [Dendrobium chrysotoxum]